MDMIEQKKQFMMANNGLFLPPEYQKVDYLQTQGVNSRIDTGVAGNDESLVFDFDYANIVRQSYGAVFGNTSSSNSSPKCYSVITPSGTGDTRQYRIVAGNRSQNSSSAINVVESGASMVGKRINFRISYGRIVVKSANYSSEYTPDDYGTVALDSSNIAIGASRVETSGGTIVGRFWHFKIWRGGTLIRNYVPVVRKSDDKAGFYDTVNHTFNPSIGTAEFIAGND